jgi:hypothetical protein
MVHGLVSSKKVELSANRELSAVAIKEVSKPLTEI